MQKHIIKDEGKIIASIYLFLESPTDDLLFIKNISNEISFEEAGFENQEALIRFLEWNIYGTNPETPWEDIDINDCIGSIEETLIKCSVLIEEPIKIFVFPTIENFILQKMKGVGGFTSWKNTILINLFPKDSWKETLKETVCHELAHALALNYNPRKTIQDDLVFEGIAEHFREHFVNGEKADWVKSISKEQAKEIFLEIRDQMNTENESLYRDLFFGTGKFPHWAGYSVGYYIVESYLKNIKILNWKEIIKGSPIKIIKIVQEGDGK